MNRRDFMKRALGGATALAATVAVAGMALPTDLRPDDVAALMQLGITYEWDQKTNTMRVTNHTQTKQTVHGVMYADYETFGPADFELAPSRIMAWGSDGSQFEWSFQHD